MYLGESKINYSPAVYYTDHISNKTGLPDHSAFLTAWIIGCLVRCKTPATALEQGNHNNQNKQYPRFHNQQFYILKVQQLLL